MGLLAGINGQAWTELASAEEAAGSNGDSELQEWGRASSLKQQRRTARRQEAAPRGLPIGTDLQPSLAESSLFGSLAEPGETHFAWEGQDGSPPSKGAALLDYQPHALFYARSTAQLKVVDSQH